MPWGCALRTSARIAKRVMQTTGPDPLDVFVTPSKLLHYPFKIEKSAGLELIIIAADAATATLFRKGKHRLSWLYITWQAFPHGGSLQGLFPLVQNTWGLGWYYVMVCCVRLAAILRSSIVVLTHALSPSVSNSPLSG